MSTGPDVITDITEFLSALYGTTAGTMFVFVGYGGHFTTNGAYKYKSHTETAFDVPGEMEHAVREIVQAPLLGDVYVSTGLHTGRIRKKNTTVSRDTIHTDVDGGLDLDRVAEFDGAFVIGSGSDGHGHIYIPVAGNPTAAEFAVLERAAQRYFGGDSKISDNDLLRPPGSVNHKGAARGADPTPVVWLIRPSGARIDKHELAAKLGADLSLAGMTNGEAKPVDLDAHPQVKAALADPILKDDGSVDRSATTMKVAAACANAFLTLDQTRWVVNTHADLAERLRGRSDDDVARCWTVAMNARQERAQQQADEDALFTPPEQQRNDTTARVK
jgi:hypothetical protein